MLNSILTCYAICGSVQNMATTSPDALVNRLSKCSPEFTKGLIAHSYGYLSVLDKHDIAPQTVGDKALIELVRLGPKGLGTLIKRLSDRAPTPIT